MNPSVRAILKENGLDIPMDDPPAHYSTTENPISPNADFSTFNTEPLLFAAGDPIDSKSKDEKYQHLRQFYLNQLRSGSRNELIEEHKKKIRNILTNGSLDDIKDLYKQRHMWRQKAHELRQDDQPICAISDCINIAVPGSEYCINHITKDKNQKLFVECPVCKRPYPVCSSCFTCRGQSE